MATETTKPEPKAKTVAEMNGDELESLIEIRDAAFRKEQKNLRALLRCVRDKEATKL